MSTTNPPSTQKPTAPVMRFLRVIDTDRSLSFYRDVLGFEVRPVQQDFGFLAVAEVVSEKRESRLATKNRGSARLFSLRPTTLKPFARRSSPAAGTQRRWRRSAGSRWK